jgi:predicted short-subunit dehydrogenase-like oxidoreductase (DUF2520 family)
LSMWVHCRSAEHDGHPYPGLDWKRGSMLRVRIIGGGRAGRSFEAALSAAGVEVSLVAGRSPAHVLAGAARGVDGVLVAVADRFVPEVAAAIDPIDEAVVLHCSGSLGLDALGPFERHRWRASLHPLVTLPDPVIGALRLRGGAFFAVSGDQLATDLALCLKGRPIVVPEKARASYHAAACIAANHLVALLGQAERVASAAGLPLEAFLPLARGALDDVSMLGVRRALTGPAARGDSATMTAHREAIDRQEHEAYDALAALASQLAASPVTAHQ